MSANRCRELLCGDPAAQNVVAGLDTGTSPAVLPLGDRHPDGAGVTPRFVRVHRVRRLNHRVRPRLSAGASLLTRLLLVASHPVALQGFPVTRTHMLLEPR